MGGILTTGCEPPIPWIGGKTILLPVIKRIIPEGQNKFVDVFGGGGSVSLSGKYAPIQIYNDYNQHLTNFYTIIKTRCRDLVNAFAGAFGKDGKLVEEIEQRIFANIRDQFNACCLVFYRANTFEEFYDSILKLMNKAENIQDKQHVWMNSMTAWELFTAREKDPELFDALMFLILMKCSFSATGKSWACKGTNAETAIRLINEASRAFQYLAVDNRDCLDIIRIHDAITTIFYCDPPYYMAEKCYSGVPLFGDAMHRALHDALLKCKGKVILSYGKYIVKEIAAPTGYILSDEQYPVVIAEDGDVVEITAENKAITVSISKADIYGNELEGASMQLIDENGDIIDEWRSDGENHIITNIPAGGYTLKEVAAPDGYIIATDIIFTIDEYGNVTVDDVEAIAETEDGIPCVTMIDNTTIVKISKQDMTTGTELSGAKLQVIDKDGNVIEEWVSTNEPHYIEAKLIAGETYTLREITAPDGYNTAEDIEFTVNADGSVTEAVMKDTKIVTTTPNVPTGDTGKSPLGYIMLFLGLVIVNVLLFTRKKKDEPTDDYAELCPDFIEGENE